MCFEDEQIFGPKNPPQKRNDNSHFLKAPIALKNCYVANPKLDQKLCSSFVCFQNQNINSSDDNNMNPHPHPPFYCLCLSLYPPIPLLISLILSWMLLILVLNKRFLLFEPKQNQRSKTPLITTTQTTTTKQPKNPNTPPPPKKKNRKWRAGN